MDATCSNRRAGGTPGKVKFGIWKPRRVVMGSPSRATGSLLRRPGRARFAEAEALDRLQDERLHLPPQPLLRHAGDAVDEALVGRGHVVAHGLDTPVRRIDHGPVAEVRRWLAAELGAPALEQLEAAQRARGRRRELVGDALELGAREALGVEVRPLRRGDAHVHGAARPDRAGREPPLAGQDLPALWVVDREGRTGVAVGLGPDRFRDVREREQQRDTDDGYALHAGTSKRVRPVSARSRAAQPSRWSFTSPIACMKAYIVVGPTKVKPSVRSAFESARELSVSVSFTTAPRVRRRGRSRAGGSKRHTKAASEPWRSIRRAACLALWMADSIFARWRTMPASPSSRTTSRVPMRATFSIAKPWKARRKFSRFRRMVSHDSPAWKPSSAIFSNRRWSSASGKPHSRSW